MLFNGLSFRSFWASFGLLWLLHQCPSYISCQIYGLVNVVFDIEEIGDCGVCDSVLILSCFCQQKVSPEVKQPRWWRANATDFTSNRHWTFRADSAQPSRLWTRCYQCKSGFAFVRLSEFCSTLSTHYAKRNSKMIKSTQKRRKKIQIN